MVAQQILDLRLSPGTQRSWVGEGSAVARSATALSRPGPKGLGEPRLHLMDVGATDGSADHRWAGRVADPSELQPNSTGQRQVTGCGEARAPNPAISNHCWRVV